MSHELTPEDRRRIYEEEKTRSEAQDLVKQQKKKFPFVRYIFFSIIFSIVIAAVSNNPAHSPYIFVAWLILFPLVWRYNKRHLAKKGLS